MAADKAAPARRRAQTARTAPGLSKERIVETAIRIIDTEGLDSFSVRNVAKALEVYPTAIYWYTPSRHLLVAEVISAVLCDLVPDAGLGWQDWLRELFRRYRAIIATHPNVAPLIGVNLVSNASLDLDLIEGILSKLEGAGFEGPGLIAAYNAVIGGMVGFTTQEFAMMPPDADEVEKDLSTLPQHLSPEDHPVLARHAAAMLNNAFILRWQNGADRPMEAGFSLYVEALVTGLEAQLPRV
ncbi:TetR/AcrR family transcriptional regulator [Pseudooceanicola sp. LIPI14-2-Ac024]|uniref:TetR/AcrR family transcriptional regulator n=1 Tax=Pseudooceanicola sp. LIPI14-2-Ac024 TaxID=3344875 RepID=UPI0035CF1DBD